MQPGNLKLGVELPLQQALPASALATSRKPLKGEEGALQSVGNGAVLCLPRKWNLQPACDSSTCRPQLGSTLHVGDVVGSTHGYQDGELSTISSCTQVVWVVGKMCRKQGNRLTPGVRFLTPNLLEVDLKPLSPGAFPRMCNYATHIFILCQTYPPSLASSSNARSTLLIMPSVFCTLLVFCHVFFLQPLGCHWSCSSCASSRHPTFLAS